MPSCAWTAKPRARRAQATGPGRRHGVAKEVTIAALPRLGLNGTQASLGYRISPSINLSTGYQHLSYGRSSGAFLDGSRQLKMDAVYLHLNLHTSQE